MSASNCSIEFVVAAQVTAEGLLQLRDFGMQLAFRQLCQLFGVGISSNHLLEHLGGRDPSDIGDNTLKFDVGALQGLLQFVGRLAALGRKAAAMAGELPQVALRPAGNEAGAQKPVAQQVGDPLSILDIGLSSWHRFHVGGVGDDQLEVALQQIVDRHPCRPWLPWSHGSPPAP